MRVYLPKVSYTFIDVCFIAIQYQGPIGNADLYSPEAQLLTSPLIVSFLNGIVSLFENGLTRYSR